MFDLSVKYNELTAEQFIELWETVWGDGPTLEQTELAMKHTLFRVSIWDGDCIVAMARMNGVEGLIDHRGKSKKQEDLTEADRLRMENKILQAKLKDQEMEIKLLKKLRELRGGGH